MTSSPVPPARSQYLLDLLAQIPDPRKRRGRRHRLAGLLAVGIAAVIAVDGKAVRGAKDKEGKAPHLVAALAHGVGAVLGQAAVTASNEIPAVRDLLKAFASLAGAVITIDALHTQSDTAQVIIGRTQTM
jgi:hypothetical protein